MKRKKAASGRFKKHKQTIEVTSVVISRRRPTVLAGLLVVITLILAGVLTYTLLSKDGNKPATQQQQQKPEATIDYDKDISEQVLVLSDDQVSQIASTQVDPSREPKIAYAKAAALAQQGKNDEAAKIYAVLVVAPEAKYRVHEDYGLIAARQGDFNVAIQQLEAAVSAVKQDTGLSEFDKAALLSRLESKLVDFKQEATL